MGRADLGSDRLIQKPGDLADALWADRSEWAIHVGSYSTLLKACSTALQSTEAAYAIRTAQADSSAWKAWCEYCSSVGTTPVRADPAALPGGSRIARLREIVLMTNALMHFMRTKKPRSNQDRMIKPRSAMNVLQGVSRVLKRNFYPQLPLNELTLPLRGLMRAYIRDNGPASLVPKRREPFTTGHVRTLLGLPAATALGFRRRFDRSELFGCSFLAANSVAFNSGFRKAELFQSNAETDHIKWDNLTLFIGSRGYRAADLTAPTLDSLNGTVGWYWACRPPRSKADQFSLVWASHPLYFVNRSTSVLDAAWQLVLLAALTLRKGIALVGAVFRDDEGLPARGVDMAHAMFAGLSAFLPIPVAQLFTWHSHRSSLACRLHAVGASHGEIQAFLRWQSDDSLRAYLRFSRHFQGDLLAKAANAVVAAVQTSNMPVYEQFDMFVAMHNAAEQAEEP